MANAHGPGQAALFRGEPEPVIGAELFKLVVVNPVDAGVADMKQMCGGGPEHHHAQGTDIASVAVIAVLALPGLGMKPGIGCEQHPLGGLFHRPAFRSGKVVAEETRDGGLAGNLADIAGADAVGDGNGDAFGDQLVALWHQ